MDHRVFLGAAFGLVALAFAGFYFAFSPASPVAPSPPVTAPPQPAPPQPAEAPAAPEIAAADAIDREIAQSDHAELRALLKANFAEDYDRAIADAAARRDAGAPGSEIGQELFAAFQAIMRPNLKHAAGADIAAIDRMVENEMALFHALGTAGAPFCLKVLGRDPSPAEAPMPDDVRRMMQQGTLYRFQAIVDGRANPRPVGPLAAEEMAAFRESLSRDGLSFEDVRSGAFLDAPAGEPGWACLRVETLYRAVARLPEEARRKIYAGMFFLGRDR